MTAVVGACCMGAFIPLEMLNWVEARWVSYVLDVLTLRLGISILTKESFDKVSQRYPKFRNSIAEIMKVRQVG